MASMSPDAELEEVARTLDTPGRRLRRSYSADDIGSTSVNSFEPHGAVPTHPRTPGCLVVLAVTAMFVGVVGIGFAAFFIGKSSGRSETGGQQPVGVEYNWPVWNHAAPQGFAGMARASDEEWRVLENLTAEELVA
eukprot:Hpha_TRINITY_DN5900_c0_g1::TRINITY_DN5900_c0_g1_i1::g.147166::m.147166